MLVGKGLQGKEMLPGFFDSVQKQAIGKLNQATITSILTLYFAIKCPVRQNAAESPFKPVLFVQIVIDERLILK